MRTPRALRQLRPSFSAVHTPFQWHSPCPPRHRNVRPGPSVHLSLPPPPRTQYLSCLYRTHVLLAALSVTSLTFFLSAAFPTQARGAGGAHPSAARREAAAAERSHRTRGARSPTCQLRTLWRLRSRFMAARSWPRRRRRYPRAVGRIRPNFRPPSSSGGSLHCAAHLLVTVRAITRAGTRVSTCGRTQVLRTRSCCGAPARRLRCCRLTCLTCAHSSGPAQRAHASR
jgi:hypothetical protein